jgi:hypothetical protein
MKYSDREGTRDFYQSADPTHIFSLIMIWENIKLVQEVIRT